MSAEFAMSDGRSRLVIEHDIDGRYRFSVHDRELPGFTATFNQADAEEIARFIKEGA